MGCILSGQCGAESSACHADYSTRYCSWSLPDKPLAAKSDKSSLEAAQMGPAVPSHLSRAWSSIPRSSRLDPKKTGEKSTANEVSRMSVEDTQLSEDIVNLINRGATVLVNAERFGPKVAGSLRSVLGSMVLAFRGVHEAFENRWMTDHPSTDLFKENLSSCNSVLADLNAFLQSGNNDDKITREKVVEMEKSILGFINTLTLSLHLARKTKEYA